MNPERVVHNSTPLGIAAMPTTDRHGRDVLLVVAKAVFEVAADGSARLVPAPRLRLHDELVTPGRPSSIRYPSDLGDEKPGTDVLLVGTAHPPRGRSVAAIDASLRVESRRGTLRKLVRVHAPRVWQRTAAGLAPVAASPLGPTPLVYELAWGGTDESDPAAPVTEPRNPVGRGVARDRSSLVGTLAPQLEDPAAPFDSRRPAPAAFAPIASDWEPRAALAGTFDAAWQRQRAPLPPIDFDPRHNHLAPAELTSSVPLVGDEPIEVNGVVPDVAWRFKLPPLAPRFASVARGSRREHATHLDTLLVDADHARVELSWRVCVPLPKKTELLEYVVLSLR